MTEDQLNQWKACVGDAIEYLTSLHMQIFPIYLETNKIYSYSVEGGDQLFNIYDIPLADLITDDDTAFMEYITKYSNQEMFNLVLRNVSPETDDETLSIIIPKTVCAMRYFDNKTRMLIDNNIEHLSNPYTLMALSTTIEMMMYEYFLIMGGEDDE